MAFIRGRLNEMVGVSKLCCFKNGVKVVEVSPSRLKLQVAGHGHAKKRHIMENVAKTFGLEKSGVEHECDAVAFVMSHLISLGWKYTPPVPYKKPTKKKRVVKS
jgi:Holliday junction resolvasome RuvABC endonuclease subunit